MTPEQHAFYLSAGELQELRRAYDGICRALGVAQGEINHHRRERIAQLVVEFAKSGEIDAAKLQKRAVALLTGLALIGWDDPLCQSPALRLEQRKRKRRRLAGRPQPDAQTKA